MAVIFYLKTKVERRLSLMARKDKVFLREFLRNNLVNQVQATIKLLRNMAFMMATSMKI